MADALQTFPFEYMHNWLRFQAVAFFSLLAVVGLAVSVIHVFRGSPWIALMVLATPVHALWIVWCKLRRDTTYEQFQPLNDALLIYGSILVTAVCTHVKPLSSPPSALIGSFIHGSIGAFTGVPCGCVDGPCEHAAGPLL